MLGPTACLPGNSDPTHLLSGPEKSNPTEAKICTSVMVTSSTHLILSKPTLLASLKQMDVIFLEKPPKFLSPFTVIQRSSHTWFCRAVHILPVGTLPPCPKHTSYTVLCSSRESSTALPTRLLHQPARIKTCSPHQNSAICRTFSCKED